MSLLALCSAGWRLPQAQSERILHPVWDRSSYKPQNNKHQEGWQVKGWHIMAKDLAYASTQWKTRLIVGQTLVA